MITLKINDVYIPVPPGLVISREKETNIFSRDPEVTDFTYPIELPLTDEAIVALNFPHVLANPVVTREYEGEFIVDGLYTSLVTVKVLGISLKRKTLRVTIIGDYGSFAKVVAEKKVNELDLGGIRTIGFLLNNQQIAERTNSLAPGGPFTVRLYYNDCDTASYMKDLASGAVVDDYVFPTALDEKINLDHLHTTLKRADEGFTEECTSIINAYDWDDDTYIDPIVHYVNSVFSDTYHSSERHFWVPWFRLAFVLRKSFEEFGFSVSGDVFADPDFMNILLPNTYSINKASISINHPSASFTDITITHEAYHVNPKNHVPRVKIADWQSDVAKNFNLQYVINFTDKTVRVNRLNNISANASEVLDISEIAYPDPEVTFEKSEFMNGYEFSFEADSDDGASGVDIKEDVGTYVDRGSVAKVADLAGIATPAVFDIAYVRSLNAYYQYGGDEWFFYCNNLGPHRTSANDNLQQISSKLNPMPLKFVNYSFQRFSGTEIKEEVRDMVLAPYSIAGMEGESLFAIDLERLVIALNANSLGLASFDASFKLVNNVNQTALPKVAIFHGFQETLSTADEYPMASSVPYSAKGLLLSGYGTCWHNPDAKGFFDLWWNIYQEQLATALQVDFKVLWNALYNRIDLNSTVFYHKELMYMCRKAQINMPFPSESTLTLVRI